MNPADREVSRNPPAPRVTISLVTHQAERWLPGCLASVSAQTLGDYELLVLDNASSDRTSEILAVAAAADARIDVKSSNVNLGYAAGHNRLIERATGEFVVLLNQDVELADAFLAEALQAFEHRPAVAAVQARVLRLARPGKRLSVVDTTGLVMQPDRRFVARGHGQPDGVAFADAGPIFGADGPVPVYRVEALRDAREPAMHGGWEVLDEDFFMYKEDVDLAWRLQRLGWNAWYSPEAVAWHARTSIGPRTARLVDIARANRRVPSWIRAISWRNQRLMQLKNDDFGDYVRDLPWIARREILSWLFVVGVDPWRMRASIDLVRLLPVTLSKRRYLARRFARGSHRSRRRLM